MSEEKLRIGLLGCGAIAQLAHIPALRRAKRVCLVAMCDSDQMLLKKVADRGGVKSRYWDYSEMLSNQEVDAVIVAVPDPLHVPLAIQAVQAGKHVLVEKPMGLKSAECRKLVQLVASKGIKLQVGCMKRHDPGVRFARRHIQEKVGRILSFSAVYQDTQFRSTMQESCLDPILTGTRNSVAHDWKSDRRRYNLTTQGAHLFDMIRYLVGPLTSVCAYEIERSGNYSWHGLLEGADGAVGHFELTCKTCGDWCERYKVCGESGSVELELGLWFYHRPATVRAFSGNEQVWTQPLVVHSNAFANQLDAFAESVFDDKRTNPDAYDGLATVELLEAIELSISTGKRIELPAPYAN